MPWAASFSQLRLPSIVGLVLRVSQKVPGPSVQVAVEEGGVWRPRAPQGVLQSQYKVQSHPYMSGVEAYLFATLALLEILLRDPD